MTSRTLRSRAGLVSTTALAIALFVFGAAAHFAHHLLDPDCDTGRGPSSHPCVSCSVLHGAALAEEAAAITPSTPSPSTEPRLHETVAPLATVLGPSAPRAPPIG